MHIASWKCQVLVINGNCQLQIGTASYSWQLLIMSTTCDLPNAFAILSENCYSHLRVVNYSRQLPHITTNCHL